MDGLALVFIAEVSAVLYSQVLRPEIQDQCSDVHRIKVAMYGIDWLNRRPALIDILTVAALMCFTLLILNWQLGAIVRPVYTALECTCLNRGERCIEAKKFDSSWWYDYWMTAVPGVFDQVKKLQAEAGVPTPAPAEIIGLAKAAG